MINRWTTKDRDVLKRIVLLAACVALPVIGWAQWTTNSNDIYNSNSGNVGIGTTSQNTRLHIKGADSNSYGQVEIESTGNDARISLYNSNGASSTGRADILMSKSSGYEGLRFMINNSDKMIVDENGNVGIGTTSPSARLQVSGGPVFVNDRGDGVTADIRMFGGNGAQETHLYSYGTGYGSGRFGIHKYGSGSAGGEVFSILPNGKVGIGTTAPSSTLEVAGDVTVSGNISAKYQDLAEWVSTTHLLPFGTVVALDTESDNGIVPSSTPYDTHVAGVVSDSPGIILGVAGPGKLKIATTGRVKVRVDASTAPIRRGDLLVTGTKEGTAMRSEMVSVGGIEMHRPGTLIGKALEPLDEGEGEILVLLSLQ